MPSFYIEHYYAWGYSIATIVLVAASLIGSISIIRSKPPIRLWILMIGVVLVCGSLCVSQVGWLILSGGDNVINGLTEPGRIKVLDSLRPIEDAMMYVGVIALVISLLLIRKSRLMVEVDHE